MTMVTTIRVYYFFGNNNNVYQNNCVRRYLKESLGERNNHDVEKCALYFHFIFEDDCGVVLVYLINVSYKQREKSV